MYEKNVWYTVFPYTKCVCHHTFISMVHTVAIRMPYVYKRMVHTFTIRMPYVFIRMVHTFAIRMPYGYIRMDHTKGNRMVHTFITYTVQFGQTYGPYVCKRMHRTPKVPYSYGQKTYAPYEYSYDFFSSEP